ncbi:MAG: Rod shape-determining protein RodA, partial [Microgenomates group bacterium GW2011_GWA2_44_7]
THPTASGNFQKQLFFAGLGLVIFFIIYFLPSQLLRASALPMYAMSIFFLVAVLAVGKVISGSKSWFGIGPFGFQPSEFAKVGLILFLAHWLSNSKRDINSVKDIAIALALGLFPVMLILLEPDTGTAIVFCFITLAMIFWAGISLFGLFVVLSPGIVTFSSLFGTAPLIITLILIIIALVIFRRNLFTSATIFVINLAASFFFDYAINLLQPHQQKRIASFLDPNADPLGSGYNALQAKVAIGSGGIFIGSIFILSMFLIIFIRLLRLTTFAKDPFSSLAIIGILTLFLVHLGINVGMNVGLTPVIGLPLPFLSYGGSSLLANMTLLGVVFNIYRSRKHYS